MASPHLKKTLLAAVCIVVAIVLSAYSSAPIRAARVPDKAHHKGDKLGVFHSHTEFMHYVTNVLRMLERGTKILCGLCILGCIKACSGLVATSFAAMWSPGLLACLAYFVAQFVGPPGIVAGIVYFGAQTKAAFVGAMAAKVALANASAIGALVCGLLSVLFQVAEAHLQPP